MEKKDWYLELLTKNYEEAIEILLKKYGKAEDDYYSEKSYERFLKGEIKSITRGKYSRTCEGLYCHHIDEIRYENLSSSNYIKWYKYPFYLQKKDKLVYCDLFEHAILHVLISKETSLEFGYSGYEVFIKKMIKEWYLASKKPKFKRKWFENCYEKAFLSFEDASIVLNEMNKIISYEEQRYEEEKKKKILKIIEENGYRKLSNMNSRPEIIKAMYTLKKEGAFPYSNQYLESIYSEQFGISIYEPVKLEVFQSNMAEYDLGGVLKNIKLFIYYMDGKIEYDEYRESSCKYNITKVEAEKIKIVEKERKAYEKKQMKIEAERAEKFYNKFPKFKKHNIRYDLKRQEVNVLLFKYYDKYNCFIKFQGAMKKYSYDDLLEKLDFLLE